MVGAEAATVDGHCGSEKESWQKIGEEAGVYKPIMRILLIFLAGPMLIEHYVGLTLGSLRPGGATEFYLRGMDISRLQFTGR